MIANAPLTESEFDRLDAFLMREEGGLTDPMDSAMLDGFLTAVVSSPNFVMPSEWLRWIWDTENGAESPEFESQAQAQDIVGLIMRHYQNLNDTLTHAPQDFEPRLMEREHEGRVVPIIDEWCTGYYKGLSLDLAAWTPLLMGQPKLLTTILLYGTDDGWEALKIKNLNLDEHEAMAHSLEDTARQVHAYWLLQRRARQASGEMPVLQRRHEPVRNIGKTGRNEPCPCGSGRKYKQCHGAN